MRKQSLEIILPLCALIAVACRSDSAGFEPVGIEPQSHTVSGVYDLTAPFSAPFHEYHYTAILRLQQDPTDSTLLKGTYENLQLFGPDGEAWGSGSAWVPMGSGALPPSGLVDGLIQPGGKIHFVLFPPGILPGWTDDTCYLTGMIASEKIVGTWQSSSPEEYGSFTAVRWKG